MSSRVYFVKPADSKEPPKARVFRKRIKQSTIAITNDERTPDVVSGDVLYTSKVGKKRKQSSQDLHENGEKGMKTAVTVVDKKTRKKSAENLRIENETPAQKFDAKDHSSHDSCSKKKTKKKTALESEVNKEETSNNIDSKTTKTSLTATPKRSRRKKISVEVTEEQVKENAAEELLVDNKVCLESSKSKKNKKRKSDLGTVDISDHTIHFGTERKKKKIKAEKQEIMTEQSTNSGKSVETCELTLKKKCKKKRKATCHAETGIDEESTGVTAITSCEQAITYLKQWKNDRKNWKFKKVRQIWLLRNMYNPDKVDDDSFRIILEYLGGLQGRACSETETSAKKLLETNSENEIVLKRIKEVLQAL